MDKDKKDIYYDFGPILSRNGVFNMVVGSRGVGKTYGAKILAVRRSISRGELFIYLRRYKEELSDAANSFFADIAHEFPNHAFRRSGKKAQVAAADVPEKDRVWRDIGYFLPLSVASNMKSVSFPKVKLIIFDEFIIEKGRRYLPNEYKAFLNFFNTVDRGQDRCRVLFLANSVSIDNPYFIGLRIRPDQMGEWARLNSGFVVCHFPESESFRSSFMASRFGRFIEGSEYAEYAVKSVFEDGHSALVGRKTDSSKYLYSIDTDSGQFSIWMDMITGSFHAQRKLPKQEIVYVLDSKRMRENVMLISRADPRIKILKNAFRNARMIFDEPSTRNAFLEVFK